MEVGSLRFAGFEGYVWSNTAYETPADAYYLNFYGDILPSNSLIRWLGFTGRVIVHLED